MKRNDETFTDLPPAKLAALAKKIDGCGGDRKAIVKLATRAVPDEGARRRLYWQLIQEGMVGPAFAQQLVWILGTPQVSDQDAPAVAGLLHRIGEPVCGFGDILEGWHEDLDRLVFAAYLLTPAAFAGREAEYAPSVQRGLAFVRGRVGEQLPAQRRREVLDELARRQADHLSVMLPVRRDGQTGELTVESSRPETVRELALLFGTPAQWDAALLEAVRGGAWSDPAGVLPQLAGLPLCELGPLLARRLDDGDGWWSMHTLLMDREDPPQALIQAAAELDRGSRIARALGALYALLAGARLARARQPIDPRIPSYLEGLELLDMGTTDESDSYGYRVVPAAMARTWVAGLKPLPAPQVHQLIRERLDDRTLGYEHLVVPLAAHFDRDLLARLYLLDAVDQLIEPGTVARIGLPLLTPLAQIIDETPVDTRWTTAGRDGALQRAYALAFAQAVSSGELSPRDEDAPLIDEAIRRLMLYGHVVPGSIRPLGQRALAPLVRHLHLAQDQAEVLSALESELDPEAFATMETEATRARVRKPVAEPLPPFPNVTDRALRALVATANQLEGHQLSKALKKAAKDPDTGRDLAWHLVEHRLLKPRPSPAVLAFLAEEVTEARAPMVVDLLAQLTEPLEGDLFPSWTWALDEMTYRAHALRPELFRARSGEAPLGCGAERATCDRAGRELGRAMQRGVDFVARRRGEAVSAEVGEEIMLQLARSQATRGLTFNVEVPYLDDDEEIEHRLESLEDVRTLALLFGNAETWDHLLLQETRRNQWSDVAAVSSALIQLSLGDLVRLLTTRGNRGVDSSAMEELLKTRGDDPEALITAAQGVAGEDDCDISAVRIALAQAAQRVLEERELAIPEGLEALIED